MFKAAGQILLVIATLALLPGVATTTCAVAELFGIETHHHTVVDSAACDSHDHHEDPPCTNECSLDFGELSLPQPLPELAGSSFVLVTWDNPVFDVSPPAVSKRGPTVPRPDRPPRVSAPDFTGVFLI